MSLHSQILAPGNDSPYEATAEFQCQNLSKPCCSKSPSYGNGLRTGNPEVGIPPGACREAGLRRTWPFSAEKTQPCGGGALWLSHSDSLNSNKQFPSSNDDIFISSKFNHKSIVILIFFTSVQMASNRQTSF